MVREQGEQWYPPHAILVSVHAWQLTAPINIEVRQGQGETAARAVIRRSQDHGAVWYVFSNSTEVVRFLGQSVRLL